MPHPSSPSALSLRHLKWLVVLLVVSNLGLGVSGYYLLREIDARYSALVTNGVVLQNDLQELTVAAVNSLRATGPTLLDAVPAARPELLERGRNTLQREQVLREKVYRKAEQSASSVGPGDFRPAGASFSQLSTQVLDLVSRGELAQARQFREQNVRPAFEAYLQGVSSAADRLEVESLRANEEVSARTSSLSQIMLGVGTWPIIATGSLILLTVTFVLGLMIIFRGREMADEP